MTIRSDTAWSLGAASAVFVVGCAEFVWRWRTESLTNVDFYGILNSGEALLDESRLLSPGVAIALAFVTIIGVSLAVGIARTRPGAALAIAWLTGLVQVVGRSDVLATEVALAYVGFACARWGTNQIRYTALLSIPLSVGIAWFHMRYRVAIGWEVLYSLRAAWDSVAAGRWLLPVMVATALLFIPWLLGVALKSAAESRQARIAQQEAEEESVRTAEIALAKAEKTQLARDVHDVVGHSLSVILAQAQSAQQSGGADAALDNIAATARRALQDVRHVLAQTSESAVPVAASVDNNPLHELVKDVQAGGIPVALDVAGAPLPLAPDLETTAYRVLQEMLTNAIRHGDNTVPIRVGITWGSQLELHVENTVADRPADAIVPRPGGTGIGSMRRRLHAVGGELIEAQPITSPDGVTVFRTQAVIPIRRGR